MPTVRWDRASVIDALQRWDAGGGDGRIATYKVWTSGRDDAPSDATITNLFGGWRAALRAAGLEPRPHPGVDRGRVT